MSATLRPSHRENIVLEGPNSVRHAIRIIVLSTTVVTLASGTIVWVFDRKDFPAFGDALWWALQTVTTVGYGDVTPKQPLGRIVGAVVLLYAVALVTVLTAAITTTFVERARRERAIREQGGQDEPGLRDVVERLDAIASRLDALERSRVASGAEGEHRGNS